MKHARAVLFGGASAAVTALIAQVNTTCPELLNQWPALVTAAVMAGVGYSMQPPRQAWSDEQRAAKVTQEAKP